MPKRLSVLRPSSNNKKAKTVSVNKEDELRDSSPISKPSNNAKNFDWCNVYPGSVPTLASPNNNTYNLKLASWNVNGIRALIKNGGLDYFKDESADIFGLQEIKCSKTKTPSALSGYHVLWSCGIKEGYAGSAILSKIKPLNVSYGIGKSRHDQEGRVITAEYDRFYFVTVYVPNAGQGLNRLPYRQHEWDPNFLEYLKNLDSKKPLVVCGDLNVAHEEIDLANPSTNHRSAGFTDEERSGFTKLLDAVNLVDTYRHLYPKREKAYTFWSYRRNARVSNTGWRLDYFLVSQRILPNVCDHEIRCGVTGSDHCPIVLYLKL